MNKSAIITYHILTLIVVIAVATKTYFFQEVPDATSQIRKEVSMTVNRNVSVWNNAGISQNDETAITDRIPNANPMMNSAWVTGRTCCLSETVHEKIDASTAISIRTVRSHGIFEIFWVAT